MSWRDEHIRQVLNATRHIDRERHLWESPALREMQRNADFLKFVQSTLDSPAQRALNELRHFGRGHASLPLFDNPAVREWLRVSDTQSSAIRDLLAACKPTENVRREFERLNTALTSPTYWLLHEGNERERQIIQQILALSSTLSPVREFIDRAGGRFTDTYLWQVLNLTNRLLEATELDEVEKYAARLEKHFRQQAETLPPGKVSVEGMLGIALTIILFLLANYISNQSEERLRERVTRAERNIVASIERLLSPEEDGKRFYIVTYPTKVVLRPRPKSPFVARLYPQQKAKVEDAKGPWLYIGFFDYEDGLTKTGWARKKYMKRLPSDAEPSMLPAVDISQLSGRREVGEAAKAAGNAKEIWVRFGESMRVVSYSPDQEPYVAGLRELLKKGTRALPENEEDGTYEILGEDRVYYVTMTLRREFAALLSSWTPDRRPAEVTLPSGA